MDLLEHPNHINQHKETHKNYLVNLDFKSPKADMEFFEDFCIARLDMQIFDFSVCRFQDEEIKKIEPFYRTMIKNYESECGDLTFERMPEKVFLLIFSILKPGMQRSNDYRCMGFVTVNEELIELVWLHPTLRNKGLMTQFFTLYAANEGMLNIQPPLTKGMQACMKKVNEIVKVNPEIIEFQNDKFKEFIEYKVKGADLSGFNAEELERIKQGLFLYHASGEAKESEFDKVVLAIIKAHRYIKDNPEFKKQLEEQVLSEAFKNDVKKMVSDYRNFGSSK